MKGTQVADKMENPRPRSDWDIPDYEKEYDWLDDQIVRLADVIMGEFVDAPGAFVASEGACDMAVRIMREQKKALEERK